MLGLPQRGRPLTYDFTSDISQPSKGTHYEPVAKQVRSTLSRYAKDGRYRDVSHHQSGDDTVSGAVATNHGSTIQSKPTVTAHMSTNQGALLPIEGRTRHVGSLLDPSSFEVISDGGDQQHLHQETDSIPDVESRGIVSEEEDEDRSLADHMASIPLQSSDHKLADELMKARLSARSSEGQSAWFVPKKELRRIINRDAVRLELIRQLRPSNTSSKKIKSYAKRVCQDVQIQEYRQDRTGNETFRKLFALLVLMDFSSSIIRCLEDEHGFSDQDLPLTLQRREDGLPELFRRGDNVRKPIECFKSWSSVNLETFHRIQWWLLAPFFLPDEDGIVKHYILQNEHILPYISPNLKEEQPVDKMGGFGEILMVHIHPDYHEFRDQVLCERGFAVKKQIQGIHRTMFKREAEILRKFSGARSHPHIVELLATYEQSRKLHLVFYRAQGNLFEYWNEIVPRPHFTLGNILWFATQCTGIANGLSRLHNLQSDSSRNTQATKELGESDP
jgi:hypothetical protein